ncbi:MAG: hypothetical protein IK125_02860 [Lachnospiraceae bacterium]|nr:hypothetical protein [Lachnospiraceae bacterium]
MANKKRRTVQKPGNNKKALSSVKLTGMTFAIIETAVKILFYAMLIYLVASGMRSAYKFGYRVFEKDTGSPTGSAFQVTVTEKTKPLELGRDLKNRGVIEDPYVFYAQYIFFSYKFQPGTYVVYSGMDSRGILDVLSGENSTEGS